MFAIFEAECTVIAHERRSKNIKTRKNRMYVDIYLPDFQIHCIYYMSALLLICRFSKRSYQNLWI